MAEALRQVRLLADWLVTAAHTSPQAPPPPASAAEGLSEQEAAILKAMLKRHPVRSKVGDLTEMLRLDEKSIRTYLQSLERKQPALVTEPHGKTGRMLTEAGISTAKSLPENAGAGLIRQDR
jgi:hypothetical protein